MRCYAAMRDGLLVCDRDGGDWTVAERFADHALECVAAHPDRPDRAFAGTFETGLHRTTDAGHTWERVGADAIDPGEDPDTRERRGVPGGGVSAMSLAVNPADPDEVWVGTEPSDLFHSTDGGDTWTRVDGFADLESLDDCAFPPRPYTHHVRWIEVDPADTARVYVGVEAGALLVTPDRGETWVERPPGSRRDNHTLATHPDAPGRVYSAAGDGYAESDDAGESWDHPEDGLAHGYVWGLAVDPGDPDRVLVSAAHGAGEAHRAASADAHLYRSVGGPEDRTWARLADCGLPTGEGVVRAALAGGRTAGEFFALTNRGLFRTGDGGDSFDRVGATWPDRYRDATGRGVAVV
ncbi:MAG: hypothetical protein ABEJ42_05895 [Halobacteriaceae archaeon]